VATGWTRLTPEELLSVCQSLEIAAGRARGRLRNAPRPLDLDLLLFGARRVARKGLILPHPRLTKRLFVLVPLAELVPFRIVPGTGRRVATLLAEARRTSTETVRPCAPPRSLGPLLARQRQA
jgi:7,8-dihydro-6-hydroxymethylpterin-pyrophosphokinase